MFLFVFADSEFQCFSKRKRNQLADWIFKLSGKILGIIPQMESFKEMYRNTKKVVSFLQHPVEDTCRMDKKKCKPYRWGWNSLYCHGESLGQRS